MSKWHINYIKTIQDYRERFKGEGEKRCLVCFVYLVCLVHLLCLVIIARKVECEKACLPATLAGALPTIGHGRQEIIGGPAAGRVQGSRFEQWNVRREKDFYLRQWV